MENEQEEVIVDNLEDTNDEDAGDSEVKPKRTPQERLEHHKGIVERLEKKLGHKPETAKAPDARLDYGNLAFHNSKSDSIKIESPDDLEFLRNTLRDTGKSQESLLDSKWFIQEMKDRQVERAVQNAIPKGTKRAGQAQGDEFSIAYAHYKETNELPADPMLRQKVVDHRYQSETTGSQFYNS